MGGQICWRGGSALTLEVKLGAFGGWICWGGKSALTLEVKLEGADHLGVWISTHFGSEFGGVCFGGLHLLGANWLGGRLALTLEVKLGGALQWDQLGVDQLGGADQHLLWK